MCHELRKSKRAIENGPRILTVSQAVLIGLGRSSGALSFAAPGI